MCVTKWSVNMCVVIKWSINVCVVTKWSVNVCVVIKSITCVSSPCLVHRRPFVTVLPFQLASVHLSLTV